MQALSASRPRSEWYTRHPDKLLCNENTDEVATLRLWLLYHQRGFMASIVRFIPASPILASLKRDYFLSFLS
ncbi:Uncharacterised protein [Yersinia aldovae]|nr:Uncharacterised protein [Yersinia aldovae]